MKLLLFLSLVLLARKNVTTIKKADIWILLGSLFAFSFINAPYWQVFHDSTLKIIAFVLLILAGVIWSYNSASDITVKKISLPVIPLAVLTGLIWIVNVKPLAADIAWRGDESFHIFLLRHLIHYIQGFSGLNSPFNTTVAALYLVIVILVAAYFLLKSTKGCKNTKFGNIIMRLFVGITILFPAIFLFHQNLPTGWTTETLSLHNMVRWPFFEKWVNLLFLLPNFGTDIRLYRIVPLLCTILIAWYLFNKFDEKFNNHVLSILFSFAFITVPVIYYFSTILYLEMPIVLVMTYCIFNIRNLLYADTTRLFGHPVWYALLLLAFLKETVMIILILLLISRFTVQMVTRKFTVNLILSELKAEILVIFPLLVYLFIRNYFIYERPYIPDIGILLNPQNYSIMAEALFRQTGVLFPLSAAGFIILFVNKERSILLVLLLLFLGILMFFIMDGPSYIGYARWNLFVVPIVFYCAYRFLTSADKPILIFCLVALIAGNYILNPIMPDGVRVSNWGCPTTDGAEYYYPYEQAIGYLASENNIKTVLLLGQYFPHWGIQFYQEKYNFYPRFLTHQFNGQQPSGVLSFDGRRFNTTDEQRYLSEFFKSCGDLGSETASVDAIIYHSVNNIDINTNAVYCGKFGSIKRMRNSLNSLYIFQNP